MPKLTKTTVSKATAQDAVRYIWDEEIKGFGLRVSPAGVKSYVYQYRTAEGVSTRMSLGKVSATLTTEQARAKAKKERRRVEDGGNPLAEKRAKRDSLTASDVLDKYLASEKFAEKAASTKAIDIGRINRHLRPTLGKKFIDHLTEESVRRAHGQIRDGKTAAIVKTGPRGLARVTGGEGAARMSIRLLKAVLTWAKKEGLCAKNPAAEVSVGSDGERDTILSSREEYERLFRTLDRMENERQVGQAHADAIRVIALTGSRRGEISGCLWRHVDLGKGVIVLPHAEHKTGKRTQQPRVIGLPSAARAIIARQPDGEPGDFVFTASRGTGAISLSGVWRKVRTEAELPEGIGLHGLRHSLASQMAMDGAQAAEIMEALGHRQLSTAQKYIHWIHDARVQLAERSSAHIAAAMSPKKKRAKVTRLPEQRRAVKG